eukprot:5091691-Pyramimonas_sp.AAC.2
MPPTLAFPRGPLLAWECPRGLHPGRSPLSSRGAPPPTCAHPRRTVIEAARARLHARLLAEIWTVAPEHVPPRLLLVGSVVTSLPS